MPSHFGKITGTKQKIKDSSTPKVSEPSFANKFEKSSSKSNSKKDFADPIMVNVNMPSFVQKVTGTKDLSTPKVFEPSFANSTFGKSLSKSSSKKDFADSIMVNGQSEKSKKLKKTGTFFGAAPPPETLNDLPSEKPKPKKANKIPLGQFQSQYNSTPLPLVWLVEECEDFVDLLKVGIFQKLSVF